MAPKRRSGPGPGVLFRKGIQDPPNFTPVETLPSQEVWQEIHVLSALEGRTQGRVSKMQFLECPLDAGFMNHRANVKPEQKVLKSIF